MEISEKPKQRNLISLTPLIDVVFILLVFFMLASSFAKWKFIELGIKESEALPLELTSQSLITVGFDQQYTLNEQALSLDMIVSRVNTQIQQQPDHLVLIKPARDLPLQQLVSVLDVVGKVAGPNISLLKDKR
ncbi:MAG: ExbD/TolR family protein [Cellvibrionaceae bacterium]